MDQFRGFAVVGMFLVNFASKFDSIHPVFKHHDTYLSFADTIMVNFLFVAGFSFRLTMVRRLIRMSRSKVYWTYIRRSLLLIGLSMLLFAFTETFLIPGEPKDSSQVNWRFAIADYLKSNLWETLAIIGMTQLVILPLVPLGSRVRLVAMFVLAFIHAILCYWFNWEFVLGYRDNWMVKLWGTGDSNSWDGGCFGPLCWAVAMLGGTLACDTIAQSGSRLKAILPLLRYGLAFTLLGYVISCGTRFYDVVDGQVGPNPHPSDEKRAESPFIPTLVNLDLRSPLRFLAEPPFVAPPESEERLENYWMMSKKIPTLSFILCATGVTFLTYAGFVWLCDVRGYRLAVLRTFGTNPLLAYCISELLTPFGHRLVPSDVSLGVSLAAFIAYCAVNYVIIQFFEWKKIFLRL